LVLHKLFTDAPSLRRRIVELGLAEFFKSMIYEHSTIALVAKFAYDVLEVFYAKAVHRMAN
jgi:hypothetical protein